MVTAVDRMTLIEGIGDEVIVCGAVLLVIICIVLAWLSTSVSEQPLIRTAVLVIERRRSSQRIATVRPSDSTQIQPPAETPVTTKVQNVYSNSVSEVNSNSSSVNDQPGTSYDSSANVKEGPSKNEDIKATPSKSSSHSDSHSEFTSADLPEVTSEQTAEVAFANISEITSLNTPEFISPVRSELPICGEEAVVGASSSTANLRRRRETNKSNLCENVINFKEITRSTDILRVEQKPSDSEQIIADGITLHCDSLHDEEIIRIRLKFLNDTIKLVDGNLREPLGDFKRRHFGEELESNKIVRLIFNGQLLRSDQETLQFYGLFDNCVVHCQISNHVTPIVPNPVESYHDLDIGRFMLPLFGVVLGLIWYCRIQYRQFFNATSTFALLGVTGLFLVSLVALCIPRREQRQQATWQNQENTSQ